jgi:hypothetical protein
MSDSRKRTTNTKNSTFAIPAALAAIPPNPNMAAMMAMTKKTTDQRSIKKDLNVRNVSISTHNH